MARGRAVMSVTDGDGQGIGAIGTFEGRPRQQRAHHHLDLFLGRMAGADHGLFHKVGGVFEHRQTGQGRHQHGNAAGLAQFQGRRRIGVDEGFLDRRLDRGHGADDLDQPVVKLHQTFGKAGLRIGGNNAVGDIAKPVAGVFDDAPSGVLQPRVKPDQPHPCSIPLRIPVASALRFKRSAFP